MPGITIKNELSLFKMKLKNLADKIEENFLRIEMKNTLWGIRDLIILHISYVEEMLGELKETENISTQQRERAETLLWPAQKLIRLENLLKKVEENPTNNSVSNQ
jgi:hypothetical protein